MSGFEDRSRAGAWSTPVEFFERVMDILPDPIFIKDEDHRWVAFNRAFCDLIGQTRRALLNRSDFDFFPEEQARTFWEKDEQVFRDGGVVINEEPLTDASGNTHILVTKKTVFTDAENRKFLVGVIRDVTEQKQTEEALRRARDELEERVLERTREVEATQAHLRQAQKMEAVGQLTGGVAHDFNNLLAVIMGNVELAQGDLCDETGLREALDGALAAAERGAALTHRLLAFSRRQALRPEPTNVNALLADLVELLGRTLGGSILLETHLGSTLATLVDPIQLETALLNLAINARDAMVGGGKLRIETNMASFDAPVREHGELIARGQYVRIAVSDTGCGISEADLERVFEPFFTTKDTGKGSGLGLSMVYGFVKQSKGHVRIESEREVGTTVELLLPIANASPSAAKVSPEPHDSACERDHRIILVVEDDAALRRITEELLASLGYRTHAAEDARSALDVLHRVPRVDALLTDVILPGGIHGPELAQRVRKRIPQLPVLFMSGHTADALSADRRLDPSIPLLGKPFRKTELKQALQALFRDAP